MIDDYLDELEKRMEQADTCQVLREAANEALESIQQAIDDAQAEVTKLAQLMVPPTSLPGVIAWIKAQIELYKPPYEAYLKQLVLYTKRLQRIQQLLVEKANELACQDLQP